jgi:hypothetical protein
MTVAWVQAKQIREFLDAYDAAEPMALRSDSAQRWLTVARRYVEHMDPLASITTVAKDPSPPDETLDGAIAALKRAGGVGV